MFSPKVLDRANVIEFRVTEQEMQHFLSLDCTLDLDSLAGLGAVMAKHFVQIASENVGKSLYKDIIINALLDFFGQLQNAGAEFGYRSAAEIFRFAGIASKIEPEWSVNAVIDACISQKLLPKVLGSRRKLEPVLKTLATLCTKEAEKIDDYFNAKTPMINLNVHYPITLEKLKRMYKSLIDNGFTSFAEA
jgi:5-methylcytosine-specific restriction protein B